MNPKNYSPSPPKRLPLLKIVRRLSSPHKSNLPAHSRCLSTNTDPRLLPFQFPAAFAQPPATVSSSSIFPLPLHKCRLSPPPISVSHRLSENASPRPSVTSSSTTPHKSRSPPLPVSISHKCHPASTETPLTSSAQICLPHPHKHRPPPLVKHRPRLVCHYPRPKTQPTL